MDLQTQCMSSKLILASPAIGGLYTITFHDNETGTITWEIPRAHQGAIALPTTAQARYIWKLGAAHLFPTHSRDLAC